MAKKKVKSDPAPVVANESTSLKKEFILDFTGKFSLVLDLVGYKPMVMTGNDVETVKKMVLACIENDPVFTVKAHNKLQEHVAAGMIPDDDA